jgi:hypothetical protein
MHIIYAAYGACAALCCHQTACSATAVAMRQFDMILVLLEYLMSVLLACASITACG